MQIPFNKPGQKWLVAVVAVGLALAYLSLAGRECLASWYGDSDRIDLARFQRAARLDPDNADYHHLIGRYYDVVVHDPASAIGPYRAAVQLNPHSARFWFDLANAYQVLDDIAGQTAALERAIEADPTTPDVAWEAANNYQVRGENEKALREFRVVLSYDPSLIASAIQFCWRIEPDVDALLRDVVPPHLDADIALLSLLMSKGETSATAKVWTSLMQVNEPLDLRYVQEYFRYLITASNIPGSLTSGTFVAGEEVQQETSNATARLIAVPSRGEMHIAQFVSGTANRTNAWVGQKSGAVWTPVGYRDKQKDVDQALLVWRQAADRPGGIIDSSRHAIKLSPYLPSAHNLVVNGNFDHEVLNGGLDWQYEKQSSVELTLDPSDFHSGTRSLLVTFDGPRVSDAGFFQYIPVQPNTTYDFTGYYKTGEFDGAGGPHFTVQDMYSQAIYYESDELKDATFWKSATGEFTTGSECRLVVLHIRRLPEGSPIRGKLWVGDFHLARKA
jgi:tetratricopeptide (TPR) repeat protein